MSDLLNNIVNLFPLSVYVNDVAEHASLKERLSAKVKSLPAYQPQSRFAWTGDVKGHGFIHLDKTFKPWIDAMVPHIHRYLELLQLRTEHLEIYFQRSWPTHTMSNQQIAPHNHENAHIRLVYYLSKPQRAGGLRLLMPNAPNEIVANLFGSSVAVAPFFIERTPFNATHADLDLEQGQVLIFPAKTMHQTLPSESDDDRISLVADIAVTLNAESECEKFMPALSMWKKL